MKITRFYQLDLEAYTDGGEVDPTEPMIPVTVEVEIDCRGGDSYEWEWKIDTVLENVIENRTWVAGRDFEPSPPQQRDLRHSIQSLLDDRSERESLFRERDQAIREDAAEQAIDRWKEERYYRERNQ